MQYIQVWVWLSGAPYSEIEPRRMKAWLPERLVVAGGYELVEGDE